LTPIEYGSYGGIRVSRTLGERRTGTPRDLERGFARALYDGEVVEADRAVESLLTRLRARVAPSETVVLVTADHGEVLVPSRTELHFQHAVEVNQSAIRVPAILWAPGRLDPGQTRGDLVCQQDLPVTLAGLAGLAPQPDTEGVDLLAADTHSGVCVSQTAWWDDLSLLALPRERRSPTFAIVDLPWKLIVRFGSEFDQIRGPWSWLGAWRSALNGLWRPDELYDLTTDPDERDDRLADEPEVATRLRLQLERALAR
jgi:arylsulfatase A-like enzyme